MPYHYHYEPNNFHFEVSYSDSIDSEFDILLKQKWEEAKEKKCFRYILDHMETKILPGKYNFVAQLNVKRAQERRKPQSVSSIMMPFNPDLFHFNKVNDDEIMLFIHNKENSVDEDQQQEGENENDESSHCLIVNVSPLEYCNSLLVPNRKDCLPQVLTENGLKLAVETLLLSHTHALRIGFNSLGAYASVNHFHFHVYYLHHHLYLETAKSCHLAGMCHEIVDYPAEGFVFQVTQSDYIKVIRAVMDLIHFLVKQSIAHNIFITRGLMFEEANQNSNFKIYKAVRIYVWARQSSFGAKNDEAFNPALCELAGHLPIKTAEAFQTVTEAQVIRVLQETCQETFLHVKAKIKEAFFTNGVC